MADGQTDRGDCNAPNAFLKKHGDNEQLSKIVYYVPNS